MTLGTQTDEPGPTSDYTGQQIYYRSIQQRTTDRLTIARLSVALGHRLVLVFPGLRRAATAGPPVVAETTAAQFLLLEVGGPRPTVRISPTGSSGCIGRPPMERVVQDIEVPVDGTADFLTWFLDNVPIEPIWLCPLRATGRTGRTDADLAALHARRRSRPTSTSVSGRLYRREPGAVDGATNRLIEHRVNAARRSEVAVFRLLLRTRGFRRPVRRRAVPLLKDRYDPGPTAAWDSTRRQWSVDDHLQGVQRARRPGPKCASAGR